MWHNPDDRDTSAPREGEGKKEKNKSVNIFISFAVSKLLESEKQMEGGMYCRGGSVLTGCR